MLLGCRRGMAGVWWERRRSWLGACCGRAVGLISWGLLWRVDWGLGVDVHRSRDPLAQRAPSHQRPSCPRRFPPPRG